MSNPLIRALSGTRHCYNLKCPFSATSISRYSTSVKQSPLPRLPHQKIPRSERDFSRPLTPPPSKTPEELSSLYPYLVRRTASIQLPVYRGWFSGRTRQIIQVKKVDGDRRTFIQHLAEGIGCGKDEVRINPTTQNVEIKGAYYDKTKDWLLQKGF